MKEVYLMGFGGFAREVYWHIVKEDNFKFKVMGFIDKIPTIVSNHKNFYDGIPVINENSFDFTGKSIIIAVGDPSLREKMFFYIINRFDDVDFPNMISSYATISSPKTIKYGKGCIVCPGCVLTCDITLKDFVILNLNTTIGHDVILENFSTTATNVSISGNVFVGKNTYFGNNSSVKEKIDICDDVIIGMGAAVVKPITERGVYVGIPARKR
jgi:sugar O-acyltransferase (sialic acid O-acetyltransferase NeuD family)